MSEWFARNRQYLGFWVTLAASLLIAASAFTLIVGAAGLVGFIGGWVATTAFPGLDREYWSNACSGGFAGVCFAILLREVAPGWLRIMLTPSHPEIRQ